MKTLKIFSVFCVAFLMCGFFAQPAQAQVPCDCNGDGQLTTTDVVWFISYLFAGGDPPVNPIYCDVDGTAGINVGDLWQCAGIWGGVAVPMPYTGVGPSFSKITFVFPEISPGPVGVPFNVNVELMHNPGPDLMGIILAFSYQNDPGGVDVQLNNVNFAGCIAPAEWTKQASIDNVNRKALLQIHAGTSNDPPLAAGTTGLIATLNFTRIANGSGTYMRPTIYPPTHSRLLITDYYANGTPPSDRVLIPLWGKNGDFNCDNVVDVSDLIYLLNYLFLGGPSPGTW
jgi:hypothetical protein